MRDRYSPTAIDWTAATENLYTTGSGRFDGGIGLGKAPISEYFLDIYKSAASNVGIRIDNYGVGDAVVRFLLATSAKFILGVDNSVAGDPFKISIGNTLGTNDVLTIDSSGNFVIGGTIAGGAYNGATISTDAGKLLIDDVTNSHSFYVEGDNGIDGIETDGFIIWGGATQLRNLTVTGGDWTIDKDVSGLLGATAGTASPSLALIVDASKDIDFDGGDVTAEKFISATGIYAEGDLDTGMVMGVLADAYYFIAGDYQMITLRGAFAKGVEININNEDIDFIVNGDTNNDVFVVDASVDRVGFATNAPATLVDINADSVRVRTSQTPASNGTGVQGEIAWDADYIYVCTATDTWERAALTGGY